MEESLLKVEEKDDGVLLVLQMIENVNKTRAEICSKKFLQAKSRLSLKKIRNKNRVVIDLNLNVNKWIVFTSN